MSEAKRQKTEVESKITIMTDQQDECLPIKSLDDLKNWKPPYSEHQVCRHHVTAPLQERVPVLNQPKTLICHDMKGGYLEDRFINGCNTEDNYYFLHWNMVDIFVYFSHHLVTVPPCGWISAAHKNGVKILGTFITEWDDGIKVCEECFKDEDVVERISSQLVEIAEYYNFDGWLLNFENKLQVCQIPFLEKFVRMLTHKMHLAKLGSQVIWYDSVLKNGDLKWQNALNDQNRVFFNCCDGIFLNYNWTEEKLEQSMQEAGERVTDVFVGVDVFGRGCPGGGGFSTDFAVTAARKFGLSVAIFAPGWIYECLEIKDFKENQFKFWEILQKLCPSRAFKSLPYFSSFCPGFGKKLYANGKVLSDKPWFNVSLQDAQPIYHSDQSPGEASVSMYSDDAYNGGGCICISVTAIDQNNIEAPPMWPSQYKGYNTTPIKILSACFKIREKCILSYTFKYPLPNVEFALVLRMSYSGEEQDLHLLGDMMDARYSSPHSLLPASVEDLEENGYDVKENPTMMEDWITRVYILNPLNLRVRVVREILVTVNAPEKKDSCVLLGELEIFPCLPKIKFSYGTLVRQCDKDGTDILQCMLYWSQLPTDYSSDLFVVNKDEKKHICRTSQFYYNLKVPIESATELEVLLSVRRYGNKNSRNVSLIIPTGLAIQTKDP